MMLAILYSLWFQSIAVYGTGYPKDTTTAWCAMVPVDPSDVYRCFPNPWGSGHVSMYYRFPDTSLIAGCILVNRGEGKLTPSMWLWQGGGPPLIMKHTLNQDGDCLLRYPSVVNHAKRGDSIDIEFKFTPSDTVVSDTIRGWIKFYYQGDTLFNGPIATKPKSPAPAPRWTPSGLLLARGATGPFDLRDLRGRSLPARPVPYGDQVLLQPVAPLRPGVYRLRWPGGSAAVLVPGS